MLYEEYLYNFGYILRTIIAHRCINILDTTCHNIDDANYVRNIVSS